MNQFFVRRFFLGCTGIGKRFGCWGRCCSGHGGFLLVFGFADFSHQCRTFFGRCARNGCDLSSGRFYLASKDFLTGAGNSFFGGMNSTTLLVILCVVVVCAVAFLSIPHSGKNKAAEKKVDPAEANKYALVAQDILKGIGGKDNVVSVSYCTTRLRFVVKNYNQVNEQAVKAAGATGILRPGKNACQVIVGTKVKSIYDELDKLLK